MNLQLMTEGPTWPPPPASPLTDDALGLLTGLHVLLVEDEVMIALDLREEMERTGADVVHARTLSRALAAAEANAFDAAVLDVNLGRGETCVPVANVLRAQGVPFVIHSGDLNRWGEVIAQLGAPVIAKPVPARRVVEGLATIAER